MPPVSQAFQNGIRFVQLGTVSDLPLAAPLIDGGTDTNAGTDASRIGIYFDRAVSAEKLAVVVLGTEVLAVFDDSIQALGVRSTNSTLVGDNDAAAFLGLGRYGAAQNSRIQAGYGANGTQNNTGLTLSVRNVAGTDIDALLIDPDGNITFANPVAFGGFSANRILISNGAGVATSAPALTNGQLLIGNSGFGPVATTLTAGANVTILNTAGGITISATGGSGSPGGADTNVQFNDAGVFGGEAAFTYNLTTNLLTAGDFLRVGGGAYSVTDAVVLARRESVAVPNGHAFRDESVWTVAAGGGGYTSFDTAVAYAGASAFAHLHGYQARNSYTGATSLTDLVGFLSHTNHSGAGTVANAIGAWIKDPTGAGPITTNYGIKIEDITRGTTDYAIYSGLGIVRFGGQLSLNGGGIGIPAAETLASVAGDYGTTIRNTNAGVAAYAYTTWRNDVNAVAVATAYSSGYTGLQFGIVAANYTTFGTFGADSNGLMLGSVGIDRPIIFGIGTAEVGRFTSTAFTSALIGIFPATAVGGASVRLPHGTAPTVPVNGDLWSTAAGFFGRVNGVTVGPFGAGNGTVTGSGAAGQVSYWSGASAITGEAAFAYNDTTNVLTVGATRVDAGTAAAPTLSFTGDPDAGIYSVGADQLGITTNGVLRVTVSTAALTLASGINLTMSGASTLVSGTGAISLNGAVTANTGITVTGGSTPPGTSGALGWGNSILYLGGAGGANVASGNNAGTLFFHGGSANDGGGLQIYGSTHASAPNSFRLTVGGSSYLIGEASVVTLASGINLAMSGASTLTTGTGLSTFNGQVTIPLNVGIGLLPSAWASNHRSIDFGTASRYSSISQQSDHASRLALTWNGYGTTGDDQWAYKQTGDSASQLILNSRTMMFRQAVVGTAAAAISWITSMSVDQSALTLASGINLAMSGASTLVSGTGVVTLNGSTTINAALTVTGLATFGSASVQAAYHNNVAGTYSTWAHNATFVGDIGTGNHIISGSSTTDFGISSRASGNLILGASTTLVATISSAALTLASGKNLAMSGASTLVSGTGVVTLNGATTINSTLTTTGIAVFPASVVGSASIRLPHGTAPSAPANGDLWSTTAGFFGRVNGVTVGPFGSGAGTVTGGGAAGQVSYWSGASAITGEAAFAYDDTTNVLTAGRVRLDVGTEANLSVSFSSDTDTGFFRSGVDELGIVVGGNLRLSLAPTLMTVIPRAKFNAAVNGNQFALTDAPSITTDAAVANTFTVTLTGNRSLSTPTNLVSGSTYFWEIKQDATGGRTLSYGGGVFTWPGGIAPVLSTAANAVDVITAVYTGAFLRAVMHKAFA